MPALTFFDATHHGYWREHVDAVPEHEAALVARGFAPLGILAAAAGEDGLGEEQFEGEDRALLATQRKGSATRVFRSADGRVVAVPSSYFGGPVVTVRSLRPDGFVIETVTAPARAPDVIPSGLTDRLWPRHVWPRPHAPRAGQSVRLVPGTLAEVLAAHEAHARALGEVAAVDDMDAVVRSFARSFAVGERVGRLVLRWTVYGLLLSLALLVAGPLAVCAGLWGTSPWGAVGGGLLALLVGYAVLADVVPTAAERLAWRLAGVVDLPAAGDDAPPGLAR